MLYDVGSSPYGILEKTKLWRGSVGTAGVRIQRAGTETWHRTSRAVKRLTRFYLFKLTKYIVQQD